MQHQELQSVMDKLQPENRDSEESRPSFQQVPLNGEETPFSSSTTLPISTEDSELTPLRSQKSMEIDKPLPRSPRYLEDQRELGKREGRPKRVCGCFASKRRCCWTISMIFLLLRIFFPLIFNSNCTRSCCFLCFPTYPLG
jgi:hypothetical protein